MKSLDVQTKAAEILSTLKQDGVMVRLIGSLAISMHCSNREPNQTRIIKDMDLVGYANDRPKIENRLKAMGYQPAEMFNLINPTRLLFFDPTDRLRVDVFLGQFRMCHTLDFSTQIPLDEPTLPVADLLATKLQIVEITKNDLDDMVALLSCHELSHQDLKDKLDVTRLADLCRRNWGIYRTFTGNIQRIAAYLQKTSLDDSEKRSITSKLDEILKSIEKSPKSLKWKIRAEIGDRWIWYELPETRLLTDKDETQS
jgi:hypothetical protein